MSSFVVGAFAALSLASQPALTDEPPPPQDNASPPESAQSLTEDWNQIAPYFEPLFTEMTRVGIDNSLFSSSERFADLSQRLDNFGPYDFQSCIPANEVSLLNGFPDLGEQLRSDNMLSDVQYATAGLMSHHMTAPAGSTSQVIATNAIHSDLIICGNDNPHIDNWRAGAYFPTRHVATFNAHALLSLLQAHAEQSNDERLVNTALFFNTITEEVTHGYQVKSAGGFTPYSDSHVTRSDYKLWDLSREAQANLITAIIFIEQDQHQRTSFLEAFMTVGSEARTMIEIIQPIFEEHGEAFVRQNPHLLLPAYRSFFENESMMDYYLPQGAGLYNDIESSERLGFDRYVLTYGALPGFEGNMFFNAADETLQIADLDEVVSWIPEDSQAAQWFVEANIALQNGEAAPLLPTGAAQPQPPAPEFQ